MLFKLSFLHDLRLLLFGDILHFVIVVGLSSVLAIPLCLFQLFPSTSVWPGP